MQANRRLKILAAEDVAVNRELIRLFLEPAGHAVDTVCDGAEALAAAKVRTYDLVLMDLQMPVMDGLAATRAIRALGGACAALPIIAVSANAVPGQVERCRESGMTDYLAKPFTKEALLEILARWSGEHATAAPNAVLASFVQQVGWPSVRGLLEMLLTQIAEFDGWPADDQAGLGRQAHALRGAAGSLGYGDVAGACGELEAACRTSSATPDTIDRARLAAGGVRRQIEAEIAHAA